MTVVQAHLPGLAEELTAGRVLRLGATRMAITSVQAGGAVWLRPADPRHEPRQRFRRGDPVEILGRAARVIAAGKTCMKLTLALAEAEGGG